MALLALLDCDIFVYRIAHTTNDVDEGIAAFRMRELIDRVLYALNTDDFACYLTAQGKESFRYQLYPEYKAHRKAPKPRHYQFLRDHLRTKYDAIICEDVEADDQIGIDSQRGENRCIVTIDKDLDQIPGFHYNFVKDYSYHVSPLEAIRFFYWQCLVGDKSVDNIEGCPKIGPVKAEAALVGCQNEKEMLSQVLTLYKKAFPEGDEAVDRLWLAGQLLWIRRNPEDPQEGWVLNTSPVSRETLLDFSKSMESSSDTNNLNSNTSSPNTPVPTIQTLS